LFREVLHGGGEDKFKVSLTPAELPAYFVSLLSEKDECADLEHVAKLLILLRSASSPAASEIVRQAIRCDVLEPLARLLEGPLAAERAQLAMAILLGTTVLRTVMAVEPACGEDDCAFRQNLLRLFETALAP
jgi:hypothetical protein